jgi:excisionase family DNA binding protein
MTIAHVCDQLRASRWTIHRLVKSGELTTVRDTSGGRRRPHVFVTADSFAAYIDRHSIPATTRTR